VVRPRMRSPEPLNHLTAFQQRLHLDAQHGAAVIFDHGAILGHIGQAAGQVTGVGGFKRVSAKPLRAPWVEMKYCSTESPSRKLA
jgi:hypothetical protein